VKQFSLLLLHNPAKAKPNQHCINKFTIQKIYNSEIAQSETITAGWRLAQFALILEKIPLDAHLFPLIFIQILETCLYCHYLDIYQEMGQKCTFVDIDY